MAHNIATTEVLKEVQDSDCSVSDWENSDIGNDTDDELDHVRDFVRRRRHTI